MRVAGLEPARISPEHFKCPASAIPPYPQTSTSPYLTTPCSTLPLRFDTQPYQRYALRFLYSTQLNPSIHYPCTTLLYLCVTLPSPYETLPLHNKTKRYSTYTRLQYTLPIHNYTQPHITITEPHHTPPLRHMTTLFYYRTRPDLTRLFPYHTQQYRY